MKRSEFIDWFEDVRYGTRRLISMVPEDAFEFHHHADSPTLEQLIRTFASLESQFVRGICTGDWNDPSNPTDARRQMCAALSEDTDDYEYSDIPDELDTVDAILEHLDIIHEETLDILAQITDDEFINRRVKVPWGEESTIQRFLVGMVEREIHHRTELYFALQHLNIPVSPMILWGP